MGIYWTFKKRRSRDHFVGTLLGFMDDGDGNGVYNMSDGSSSDYTHSDVIPLLTAVLFKYSIIFYSSTVLINNLRSTFISYCKYYTHYR